MMALNWNTQEHYMAMKCTFIVVICHFFFSSNEMKVIANLQQDCFEIITVFSLNRHIIVETGTEKELRRHNVLAMTFF